MVVLSGSVLLGGCGGRGGAESTPKTGRPSASQSAAVPTSPMAHARASGGSRVSALKGRIAFSAGPLEPSRSTVYVYELSTRRPTQLIGHPSWCRRPSGERQRCLPVQRPA